MRCPSCHAKCLPDAAVCSGCGAALPPDCIPNMRPVSRLAYRICRSGKELLAVFCLSFLIFAGAASTLSCAAAVYEPLTAAAGLDNFSLHTTDGDRPLTEQESALLTEKASQARTLAAKYAVGAVLGLLLFSGSLVLLVRVFVVSSRLRASGGSTEAIPAEQSSAGAERSADTGA
ncbi:MAG: hypothetical protein PUC59_00050, partial [Firmicutes bacterium]|nr:hypothetical protein [Bacillota bacterium]